MNHHITIDALLMGKNEWFVNLIDTAVTADDSRHQMTRSPASKS